MYLSKKNCAFYTKLDLLKKYRIQISTNVYKISE